MKNWIHYSSEIIIQIFIQSNLSYTPICSIIEVRMKLELSIELNFLVTEQAVSYRC